MIKPYPGHNGPPTIKQASTVDILALRRLAIKALSFSPISKLIYSLFQSEPKSLSNITSEKVAIANGWLVLKDVFLLRISQTETKSESIVNDFESVLRLQSSYLRFDNILNYSLLMGPTSMMLHHAVNIALI